MNREKKNQIIDFCNQNQILFYKDHGLKSYNTFRVGGDTELLIMPDHTSQLLLLQNLLSKINVEPFLIGGGSNLLISDSGYDGVVIKINYPEKIEIITQQDESLIFKVPASVRSAYVAKKISAMEFKGLEFLTTIPGTIGGALVQNAGCYGFEISDCVQQISVSEQGNFYEINNSLAEFSYRSSIFKQNKHLFIHDCTIEVRRGVQSEIDELIHKYKENRIRTQPQNRKNAGSIFKNPTGAKAWGLIKDAGLSGYRIGDAEISTDHANFILNSGNASSNDIFQIICHVQKTVFEKFNIQLEPEVIFLGYF